METHVYILCILALYPFIMTPLPEIPYSCHPVRKNSSWILSVRHILNILSTKLFPVPPRECMHTSNLESLQPFLSPSEGDSMYNTVLEELSLWSKAAVVYIPVLPRTSLMILPEFHNLSVP